MTATRCRSCVALLRKYSGERLPFLWVSMGDQPVANPITHILERPHTGLAHALSKDDDYNGVYIPKDSIIIPNIWYLQDISTVFRTCLLISNCRHMFHDPDVYENPMEFNPDRYGNVDAEIDKVTDLIFGFGRRVCPGMHLAEGTVFAIVSTALATCEILPALNANGDAIQATPTYTSGTIV